MSKNVDAEAGNGSAAALKASSLLFYYFLLVQQIHHDKTNNYGVVKLGVCIIQSKQQL